ncbi:MAG: molybdopterin synthase sulfur carrier subunit [Chloroflexi bacterium]|jgi:molybdopterin synthase sulfur carrier subunit|nr:MAG: molybdopterin synthase sulfur carrier subunit [Chloroflexota bacterium]|tara:strand:- start:3698 stop:3985 length:288 start_codon:yes stop_codon:yes gene_type:complete
MTIKVKIPTPLRSLTQDQGLVSISATNVESAINELEKQFPGIKERVCEEDGSLRRFVNIYINGEDIRFLDDLQSSIKDNDEISIVPAVAGGTIEI